MFAPSTNLSICNLHNNVIQNLGIKHHNAMASNNTAYNALLEYNIVNGNHFFVLKINENVVLMCRSQEREVRHQACGKQLH